MPAVKFPSSFVSSVHHLPVRSAAASGPSAEQIGEIKQRLAEAQLQAGRQRFASAVEAYKAVQSTIYRMLHPAHVIDVHLAHDAFALPVGPLVETKVSEAALKLVEATRASVVDVGPPVLALGYEQPKDFDHFDAVGVELPAHVDASASVEVGLGLLAQGATAQAVEVFEAVAADLGAPSTPAERATVAATMLNLASGYLGLGQAERAVEASVGAMRLFEELEDHAGRSMALHNQAVALRTLGKAEDAAVAFDQAGAALSEVERDWGHTAEPSEVTARVRTLDRQVVGGSPSGARLGRGSLLDGGLRSESSLTAVPAVRSIAPGRELGDLSFIRDRDAQALAVRWAGDDGWGSVTVPTPVEATATAKSWAFHIQAGEATRTLEWVDGVRPTVESLIDAIYKPRIEAERLDELVWRPGNDLVFAAYLTHVYAFVVPQALGDCYQGLGNHQRAEEHYLRAAQYSYINRELEAPALWGRIARNLQTWGDELYRNDRTDEAKAVYGRLVAEDGTVPESAPLYSLPVFAGAAAAARTVIQRSGSGPAGLQPSISIPVLTVLARWKLLGAGLDFFGTAYSPIFTFEYLQQVARSFAQQAIQAERDFVNFQSQAEAEAATRRELEGAAALADAALEISREQVRAAEDDQAAMDASVALANRRANNAAADRAGYADAGYWQYKAQSIAAAHGAGTDWHGSEIRSLAADIERGSWEGDPGKLAAAATLLGGKKSYEYQLDRMDRTVKEMQAMIPIAQAQAAAAAHRAEAARLSEEAAELRRDLADDALAAFENELFTAELWARMATAMRDLSGQYQEWAIRAAKLMERAYSFETDHDLKVVKASYPAGSTAGLLGSDHLLRDIDSFTYHHVAHTRSKVGQVKDVVSLACDYPFLFRDLQQTGRISFETSLDEFDRRHPGFYGQRLTGVEVEVVGLLPPDGLSGSLRGGALSRYRTADGGYKVRVHGVDTLALSDFTIRNDAFVFRADPRIHGLFEGHGLGTTWELDLPRRANNLDYRLLVDVRLVLYYTAQFSASLRESVRSAVPTPGELVHVRDFALRYDFPEAWYALVDEGATELEVTPQHLPRNETAFTTDKLGLQVITSAGVSPAGLQVTLTPPGRPPLQLTTDASGGLEVASAAAASLGGDLLGTWAISLTPQPGSALAAPDGSLRGDLIEQVAMVVQYGFAWPE